MKNIALAFCADNQPVAEAIAHGLQHSAYQIEQFQCKGTIPALPLADQLKVFDGPVILLISDNFLKSISCMNKALNLLQQKQIKILPVVVDGYVRDEETGKLLPVPTQFEKIGDIIPYINYWQNQYLDLRSQKKKLELEEGLDQEAFAEHLRTLREVSSEASEFLRVLRNMPHLNGAEFTANHFEALFSFLEDMDEWTALQARVPELSIDLHVMASPEPAPAQEPAVVQDSFEVDILQDIQDWYESGAEQTEDEDQTESEIPAREEPMPITASPEIPENDFEDIGEEEEDNFASEEEEEDEDEDEEDDQSTGDYPNENFFDEEEEAPNSDSDGEETESLDMKEEKDPAPGMPADATREETEEILVQAIQMANAGRYEESLAYLQHAVHTFPESAGLRYHYALLLAQNATDYQPAIDQLHMLLDYHPLDEQANFLMGELHELLQHNDLATRYYTKVAEINPAYPDIYYRLGISALKSDPDLPERAARYFKKACKTNPEHIDAHYQYALLCAEPLDKVEKAEKYLHKTLDLNPKHPFANYDLALLHHRNGAMGRAKKHYLRAIAINPELQTPENDLAFGMFAEEAQPAAPFVAMDTLQDTSTSDLPTSDKEQLIQTLKANIALLEQVLQSQNEEQERSLAEPEEEEPTTPAQTVLITGASSGIGKAAAYLFAQHGYRVILTGRRAPLLHDICEDLYTQYQAETYALSFDVRHEEETRHAIEQLPAEWQDIDILINNAGKAKGLDPIHEGHLEHWEEMIDTNIKGILYVTRVVAPAMVARRKGHIINISSIAGKEIYPKGNVYCASKAAVDALTAGMRLDLHAHNIRVSQVSPGHVEETEFALVRFDGDSERAKIYEDFKPLTSRDVAQTIFFIASQPPHVNIQDVVLYGTQQASATIIDRSGR